MQAIAQSAGSSPSVSFSLHSGFAWSGNSRHEFPRIATDASVSPGISVSGGLILGPVVRLSGALLNLSLEVGWGEEKASVRFRGYEIVYGLQRLPVFVWATVRSETVLSPFIRVGAGTVRTDYRSMFTDVYDPGNIRFHQWTFGYGFGGGLDYRLNPTWGIEIFVDSWVTPGKMVAIDGSGDEQGFLGGFSLAAFGARVIVTP